MFRICSKCDFELHSSEGPECPACNGLQKENNLSGGKSFWGRAFGTGPNDKRFKNWYLAIAIITLILLIQALVLS